MSKCDATSLALERMGLKARAPHEYTHKLTQAESTSGQGTLRALEILISTNLLGLVTRLFGDAGRDSAAFMLRMECSALLTSCAFVAGSAMDCCLRKVRVVDLPGLPVLTSVSSLLCGQILACDFKSVHSYDE